MPAGILRQILRAAIEEHIDPRELAVLKVVERDERRILAMTAARLEEALDERQRGGT